MKRTVVFEACNYVDDKGEQCDKVALYCVGEEDDCLHVCAKHLGPAKELFEENVIVVYRWVWGQIKDESLDKKEIDDLRVDGSRCPLGHHDKDGPCRNDYCHCQCRHCRSECDNHV